MKKTVIILVKTGLMVLWLLAAWLNTYGFEQAPMYTCIISAINILLARYNMTGMISVIEKENTIQDNLMNKYSIAAGIAAAPFMMLIRDELNSNRLNIPYIIAMTFLLASTFILTIKARKGQK